MGVRQTLPHRREPWGQTPAAPATALPVQVRFLLHRSSRRDACTGFPSRPFGYDTHTQSVSPRVCVSLTPLPNGTTHHGAHFYPPMVRFGGCVWWVASGPSVLTASWCCPVISRFHAHARVTIRLRALPLLDELLRKQTWNQRDPRGVFLPRT